MGRNSSHSLTLSRLLLTLLCLSSAVARAEQPPADPIEWTKPASRPEFRQLIRDEQYQQRFQAARQEIGSLDDLEASAVPVAGTEIIAVTPGSPADSLGIRVGDIITHCNGDVLWLGGQLSSYGEEEREIRLVSSGGDVRLLGLPSGKIGVDTREFWHPELQYLRSGNRDPRWDREVVIGLLMAETDPELAETCWARAVAAGYPRDHRSAISGAVIAMHSGRVDSAVDFAFFCLEQDPDGDEAVHPLMLFRLAMANYKLKHALEVVKRHPAVLDADSVPLLEDLISLHEHRSLEDRCVPTPSQLAEQMYRDEFRSRAMPLNDHPSVKSHVDRLRSSPQSQLTAATANFALAAFGPPYPARNVDLQVRFRLKATDGESSEFLKIFECRLADVQHWGHPERLRRGSETLLFVGFQDGGVVRASAGGMPVFGIENSRARDGWEQDQTVRLVRVGGQGEVFVNGTRVVYAPMYDDVDFVAVILKSVGMEVEILNLEVVELIERL